MADNIKGVRARLDELTEQVKADHGKWPAMAAYLSKVLRCPNPHPEARAWLEDRMAEFAKKDLVTVVKIAYDEEGHAEDRRAASMVILRNAKMMPDARTRADHLQALTQNTRLHGDARAEAERLLQVERQLEDVRSAARMHNGVAKRDELRGIAKNPAYYKEARLEAGHLLLDETKKLTDAYYAARTIMDDEGFLRETQVEAAGIFVDYCKATQRALGMMGDIVTSGKWPEVAEEAGIWLVDAHIESKDVGMAKRIADAPNTPQKVKEHAAKRFEEMGFRPIERRKEKKTMPGMPAFKPEAMRAKIEAARGVPPSPVEMTPGRKGVITLRGPGVK